MKIAGECPVELRGKGNSSRHYATKKAHISEPCLEGVLNFSLKGFVKLIKMKFYFTRGF